VTTLRAGRCSILGMGIDGIFCLRHRIQTGSGAHSASCTMGTGISYPGVKRLGREADHLPPSSAEVKNVWSCTSTWYDRSPWSVL